MRSSDCDRVKLICCDVEGVAGGVIVRVVVAVLDLVSLDSLDWCEMDSVAEGLETEKPLVREKLRDMDLIIVKPVRETLIEIDPREGRSLDTDSVTECDAVLSVTVIWAVDDFEPDGEACVLEKLGEMDSFSDAVRREDEISCVKE